jgi:hypothetical protein
MGAGALEWPTKLLKTIRIPDVRSISLKDRDKLAALGSAVWEGESPPNFEEVEVPSSTIRKLDEFVLRLVGASLPVKQLYGDLHRTCCERLSLGRGRHAAAKSQVAQDVKVVAESVAESIRRVLEGKQFPEAFAPAGTSLSTVKLPEKETLTVTAVPFMDRVDVLITDSHGSRLLEGAYPLTCAEVLVRAVLLGRRSFALPVDEDICRELLRKFAPWVRELDEEIAQAQANSALGTKYERDLRAAVLSHLGISEAASAPHVWGEHSSKRS